MGGSFTIGRLRRTLTPGSGVVRAALRALLLLLLATCQVDKLTNTPPPVATLALAPTQLRDSAALGSTRMGGDSVAVANAGQGTLSWSARLARGESWLAIVSASSGIAPAKLRLGFNPLGLPMGVYRDTVVVSAENAEGSPARVPVEFTVHPCMPVSLVLDAQVVDSLTNRDCTAPHRSTSFARLYAFAANAGDSVSVVMTSGPVDAYVVLDSSQADGTAPLALNDSCAAGRDACVRYQRLPRAGTYWIEATSAGAGQTGAFALAVSRPRPPTAAASLAQLRKDSVTVIPAGGGTDQATVVLRGVLTDPDATDSLRLEVEVRPVGTPFTGVPTQMGGRVASGQPGFVVVPGLANNTGYHWQARVTDQTGRASSTWTAFGANPESAPDFTTGVPVAPDSVVGLGQFQSDGSTAIPAGGTALSRTVFFKGRVSDANLGDQLRLDVEVQPVGTAFTGVPTGSGAPVPNGGTATASNTVPLTDNMSYHWQARAVDNTGREGPWVAFGANAESAADFGVAVAVTQLAFSAQPSNAVAGVAIAPAVRVTALGALGSADTVKSFTGQVTVAFAANPGGGTLSGTKTVSAKGGVATFPDLSVDRVASRYTLQATATTGGSTLTATSDTFAISPAAAKLLTFTVQPTTAPAGAAISPAVQVTARDSFGNVATAFIDTVTIAIGTNPAGGTLGGTLKRVATAGVASFADLTIDKAGTGYTLTGAATGLTAAASGAFTITAAAAGKLAFVTPPGAAAQSGVPFAQQPVVQVQDANGNPVSQAGVTVTATLATGPAGATVANAAATSDANGRATFSGLAISGATGGYTLTFTASGLAPLTSGTITLSAGPAAKLAMMTQPSGTAQSGVAFARQPVVQLQDATGNPVSQSGVQVTAAIATGSPALSGTNPVATTANGRATFTNLTITGVAGPRTLGFSATGLTAVTSSTVNVTAGAASQIVFTVQPSNVAAGAAIAPAVQVTARDGSGNTVTSFTDSVEVALAANPGGATLAGAKKVKAVSGVATFANLSLDKSSAAYTLSAAATGFAGDTSAGFDVRPAAATRLAFTVQPGSTTANVTLTPPVQVTAQDAFGNRDTTYHDSVAVALGLNPGGAALGGARKVQAVAGLATFATLTLDKAGSGYTLAASATGLTGDTSTPFNITAGTVSAALSTLSAAPGTITASSGDSQATVTVTAKDASGNPIQGATVVLAATGTGNSVVQPAGATDAGGVATGTLSSTVAEAKTISATINGVTVTQTATVTVEPAVVSAARSTLVASPAAITASSGTSTSTLTVTARDAFDNPVAGATAVLAAGGGGVTLTPPPDGTNASGVATGTLSATLVGDKIVSVTINGTAVTQTDTVTVAPAAASALVFTVQPSTTSAGASIAPPVQVTARDPFGNTATGFVANVTVALGANPGGGTLGGVLTHAAVTGVATFGDLSVNKAGTGYTLTVAASGLTGATSSAFTVNPGTGTALAFTVQPSSDVAGAALTPAVQVTAQDGQGNTITIFTGTVSLALGLNPGGATLGGTTSVPAVNGVATFANLSLNKVGSGYTLTASATGFTAATSAAFDIAPAAAAKLAFTVQPSGVAAGAAIAPAVQVTARDAFDNDVLGFTGNVTMALGANPGGGTLAGTLTRPAAVGVASFADLSVNKAGAGYTLAATASGLTGATSGAFTVTAAGATQLAITRQPAAAAQSGVALTTQPQLQLRDANGNDVAQGSVTVTAQVATGPAGATLVNATATTNLSGLATFSGLALSGPVGSYTLRFVSGALVPDTSTSIALSAGAAARLALVTQPSASVQNDVAFPQQPVVQLEDAAGNPVATSGTVITAAVATGGGTLGGTLTATTSGGAAAFTNLKITGTVGGRTLVFTAGTLASVTSGTVTVAAGAATQIAVNAGNHQAAPAGTPVTMPPSVIVRDVSGNVVAGVAVTFALPGTSNGALTGASQSSDVGGVAQVASWTLSTTAKPDTMTATSTGLTGSPVTFVDTAKVGAAASLAKFSGDNQVGQVAESLQTPLVVRVTDANGNPVPGVTTAWAAASGGGHVNPTSTTTGSDGLAQTYRILGTLPGTNTTTATVTLTGGPTTVTFTETAQVGGATHMAYADSSVRRDTVGQTVPVPLAVKVTDDLTNPVAGVPISWAVIDGGGSVDSATSHTDASGVATTRWTLGTAMSPTDSTQFVQASGVAAPLTFQAVTFPGPVSAAQTSVTATSPITASTGSSQSSITVTARDQFGNVIKGKTVTLAATGTGNTVTNPAAATDANGVATGSLSSTKAEAKTVSAAVGGVAIGQQAVVTVNPAAASSLSYVVQPTGAAAGATIAPPVQVEIRDQFSNRVTAATNGVSLAIGTNPGGGTLTGGGTTAAVAGVATFSGLSIDKAGVGYTLNAASTGITGATSAQFTITAGGVSAVQSTVTATSPITAGGAAATITVTAHDQFGNPIQGASVVLAASGTGNTLTQPVGTTGANGVATGTLASTVAESKTVSATVSGVGVTQTATVVVDPGTAAALHFTQQPSSAVAGVAISPTIQVTARDANGNVAAGFSGAVTLTFANTAGGGTLSGGGPVTAVNGVASFSSVSVDKVGTGYTLQASATGPTAATSASFAITPAAASTLAFTIQPGNTVAGVAIAPAVQVTARDDFGNTATGFSGSVTVAIGTNAGGGTLSGIASKPAVAGVVSFADLAINRTGTGYTLTAAATSLTGATSTAFNITAATASRLVFSQQPSAVVAGAAISPAVVVTALDANDNVATGFTGTVTVAIGSNPGSGTLSGTAGVAASAGVATFSTLSINRAGSGYTLTAAATGPAGATSTTFDVTPAAASAVFFTQQPTSAVAGAGITPAVQVTARDQFGNTATGFTGNVTLLIQANPGGGTLSGGGPVAAVAGVATFANVSINRTGTGYTLAAASGVLTGATSAGFDITPDQAATLVFSQQPSNTVAGAAIAPAVQVTARDQFGNIASSFTGNVTLAIQTNPVGGTLSGGGPVAAVAGIATFPAASINKVGTGYTLTGTATGLTAATSGTFNITAGTAAQLVFSVQPTSATAGAAIAPAVQVTALDGNGNTATGFAGNVTLALAANPGGGTLSGGGPVAAVAGVATFASVSINKIGTGYTLSASATGPAAATSTGFDITPAAATQLAFTVQPTTAAAGAAVAPAVQVTAEDQFGNTAPSFSGTVTVAIGTNPSGGTLSGTLGVPATSGVATFSDLEINRTGTGYTLTAAATGLTGATSGTFNITPGAAAQLVFSRQPTASTAGSNITPPPQVTVQDAFGNTATEFTGNVTIAIGTNPAAGTLSGTKIVGATAGVVAFGGLSIDKAASGYTLSATADALAPATSAAFTITPAGATALAFTQQPTNATAGQAIAPAVQVTAHDQFGNTATAFTGNVTLAIGTNPGSGTLSGGGPIAAVAGVATFSAASIDKAGTGYTLTVAGGGLTGATSSAFDVAAGAVSASQSTVTANSPIVAGSGTSTITVTAKDANGNPVQGATVTLAATGDGNSLIQPSGTTNASGVATGTLSSTAAGSKSVTATINSVAITQTAAVVVTAGAVSAAQSSVVATSPIAAGGATSTVTVTARDANGNPIQGATVTLTASGTGNTLTQPGGTTNASGVATGTLASTTAESKTVSATINSVAITQTATVVVTPGAVSAAQSTVSATSPITASGSTSQSTITVTARDGLGNPIPGATVVLAASGTGNTLTQPGGTTNTNGVATGTLSSTIAGSKIVTATINSVGVTQTDTVVVNAGTATQLAFTVEPTSATAGATITPPVQVTAQDAFGNTVSTFASGVTLAIGTNPAGGALTGGGPVTPASGVATFNGVSIDKAGTGYTLTASGGGLTVATSGTFNITSGSVSASQSTVTASSPIVAGGGPSTITVTARDGLGNPVQGATVTLTASGTGNTLNQPGSTTNANGVVTGTLASTVAESKTVSATINSVAITQTATVVVNPGAVSAAQSTVTATSPIVAGSGTSTVTVTAKDANGNPIEGATVVLAATGTGNTLTQPATATNGSGVVTGTLSSTVAESKTVSATISGVGVTPTATVVVNPGTATELVVTTQPSAVVAGAAISPAVEVTARDANGNTATGFTGNVSLALAANPGGGTLSGSGPVAAVAGVATFSSVSINKVGTGYTLTATATGVTAATSDAFNVTPGSAAALVFSVQPTSAAAGVAISPAVQVTAQDANGNTATGFGGNITLALAANPGSGTLSGTATQPASAGVATFAGLSIDKVGAGYTLSAAATGPTSATSSAFNITSAAATALFFTVEPSNATAGAGITPSVQVTARDEFGNTATGFAGDVTLAIGNNAGGGTLSGTLTHPALAGVATFAGLSIDKAGTGYILTAASGVLTVATSTGFDITAGAVSAGQSTVSASPGTITASDGTSQSTITVTARDALGNPIAGATVVLAATPATGNTLTQPGGATNGSGVATGTLSSTAAGTKTVSATINGVAIGQTASVQVDAAAPASIAVQAGDAQTATVGTAVPIDPAVIVRDQFNNPVAAVAVTFAVTLGGGTVDPTTPVSTGTDGIATVTSWTLGQITGSNQLRATATGGGISNNPITFTAVGSPAAPSASESAVNAAPSPITASNGGSVSTITVTVRDAFNNPVEGATVTLASNGTGNTVTQPVGTTDANGQITGTLSSTKAELKTITATVNGSVPLNQTAAVTVDPATADHLTFTTEPQDVNVGSTLPAVAVTAWDQFGNVATGFTGNVTMAIDNDASLLKNAVLGGTTLVAAVSGVASFADLTIDQAGIGYTLLATGAGVTGATSNAFTVITVLP